MFVQTYFNENVCQNITRAKQLFFPDDIKPKQFRVSYLTSDASADCKDGRNIINGIGQGSGQEDICAVITGGNCDATPAELYVVVNYKALEFVSIDIILQVVLLLINVRMQVCDSTDFSKGITGTIHVSKVEEPNTDHGQPFVC